MNIKKIIDAEKWNFSKARLLHRLGFPAVEYNESLDRIEDAYKKEYAEWQEGDERLRRMHEEHLAEYYKRITELEGALEDIATYATIETPPVVTEIINGMLNKED